MKNIAALALVLLIFTGCAGRSDYYTAVDNRGRYKAEQKKITIDARLKMFDKAMEVAGKTETPLDDVLVYLRYDQVIAADETGEEQPLLPPADGPEYIRTIGHFVMPFVPWYFTSKMVGDGYRAIKDVAGHRYTTGGGPLNIYDSYNQQSLQAGRDGSLVGPSRVLTDSHDSMPPDTGLDGAVEEAGGGE